MARPLGSAPRSETSRIDSRCIELDTVRPQLSAGDEPPNRAKADVEPLSRLFGAQLFGEFVLLFGGGHFATPCSTPASASACSGVTVAPLAASRVMRA